MNSSRTSGAVPVVKATIVGNNETGSDKDSIGSLTEVNLLPVASQVNENAGSSSELPKAVRMEYMSSKCAFCLVL